MQWQKHFLSLGGYWIVKLTLFALAGGISLGILVGLGRISKKKWVYYPVTFYVNLIRNIPLILVIFWFYFVMPIIVGRPMDPFPSAVISFIIFEATYFGEILRAGYQSVSKGQIDADTRRGSPMFRPPAILIPLPSGGCFPV
jgi:glutamate/aspartate transport system permease protein